MRVVGCLLFVSFQSIHTNQTEVKSGLLTDTLYSCLLSLSLSGLSLSSFMHTLLGPIVVYIYMLHSNWEQFSFQLMLHRAHATQSHPFHLLTLTVYSCIHLQTHSHSTNHSLIPQAHAITPLHSESVSQPFFHFWLFTCVTVIKPSVLQLSNCKPWKLISNLFPRTKQMPPASNENAELLILHSCC